jgi:hypothetical protein
MLELKAWRALRRTGDADQLRGFLGPHSATSQPAVGGITKLARPESEPDDRSKFIRYGRSSAQLIEWRRSGQLEIAKSRAYVQESAGVRGLWALSKSEGIVSAIETDAKRKEDRLRLLEATRTQFEPVIVLTTDESFAPHLNGSATPFADVLDQKISRFDSPPPSVTDLVAILGVEELEAARTFRNLRHAEPDAIERFVLVLVLPALGTKCHPHSIALPEADDATILRAAEHLGELQESDIGPCTHQIRIVLGDGRVFVLSPKIRSEHLEDTDCPEPKMIRENGVWIGQNVLARRLLGNTSVKWSRANEARLEFGPIDGMELARAAKQGVQLMPGSLTLEPEFLVGAAMLSYGDAQ